MRVGSGEFTYEWHENWATILNTESGRANGWTHGVVASKSGDVHVFNQAQPAVLRFRPDGRLKNAWGDRFGRAHGMTLVEDDDVEFLWLTDQNSAEVVKTTLDDRTVMSIQQAPHPIYADGASTCRRGSRLTRHAWAGTATSGSPTGTGATSSTVTTKPVAHLGDNAQTVDVKGWPNHPKELVVSGKFNSPHGMTCDAADNLYIAEWIIGGRITKLERL